MTFGRVTALLTAGAIAVVPVETLLAQQSAKTPPPSAQTARPEQRASRAVAQGFSVVLVLADLTTSTVQDDVPPAARRALADMKDFLPYKSYRLLDAAWILGQASSGVVTRLRGPDEQEYELRMNTSSARSATTPHPDTTVFGRSSDSVYVRFTLNEAGYRTAPADVTVADRMTEENRRLLQQQVASLEKAIRDERNRKEIGMSDDAKIRALEADLIAARERLTRTTRSASRTYATTPKSSAGPIIDTSFTMDIGETVVVGTSRLKGNSRALIALLTAVPSKGSRQPTELR